jgi:hypothetical protein
MSIRAWFWALTFSAALWVLIGVAVVAAVKALS